VGEGKGESGEELTRYSEPVVISPCAHLDSDTSGAFHAISIYRLLEPYQGHRRDLQALFDDMSGGRRRKDEAVERCAFATVWS